MSPIVSCLYCSGEFHVRGFYRHKATHPKRSAKWYSYDGVMREMLDHVNRRYEAAMLNWCYISAQARADMGYLGTTGPWPHQMSINV